MLFKDTAIFALVMIVMGTLLIAGLLAIGLVMSMVTGGDLSPAERRRRQANETH